MLSALSWDGELAYVVNSNTIAYSFQTDFVIYSSASAGSPRWLQVNIWSSTFTADESKDETSESLSRGVAPAAE